MVRRDAWPLAVVLTAAFWIACSPTTELPAEEPAPVPEVAPECDIAVAEGVELSETTRCELALLRERCNEGDACLVDCIANGRDRSVGEDGEVVTVAGGCWHLCFAYSDLDDWDVPEGFDACSEADGSPG